MNILQLCYKPPYPAKDGGSIGMYSIGEGLTRIGATVKVLTFYSDKDPFNKDMLTKEYIDTYSPEGVYVDLKPDIFSALWCVISAKSYVVDRFNSQQMKNKLIRTLKKSKYDVVQIESINLVNYIPIIRQYSKAIISFHCPNIEHLIWQRLYKNERYNIFKRWYLKNTSLNMKYFESQHINDFDIVFPVTKVDSESFVALGCRKPCIGVPIGFNALDELPETSVQPNTLFHIGSMNWFPNEQGIKWFLHDVWQKVIELSPEVELHLAGRNMPPWLQKGRWPNVNVVGQVADSMLFMCSKQIMVVPLLSGSGIRIKILEAMSCGKTVVATSIAAEGILYTDKVNILIANTPQEFATNIKELLDKPDYCEQIGQNALKLIKEQYDTNTIAQTILSYYQDLLDKK